MLSLPLTHSNPVVHARTASLHGEVAFLSQEEQEQRGNELVGAGALLVRLPPPTSHVRGHLGSLLEELVERELARAGAPSPYLAAWSAMPDEAHARLVDQLSRASDAGATGLAIALGTLASIAQPSLCPDDSAILRWLAESTTALPLVLLVDDADIMLTGYEAPRSLAALLVQERRDSDPPIALTGEDATNVEHLPAVAPVDPVPSVDAVVAIISAEPVTPAPLTALEIVMTPEPPTVMHGSASIPQLALRTVAPSPTSDAEVVDAQPAEIAPATSAQPADAEGMSGAQAVEPRMSRAMTRRRSARPPAPDSAAETVHNAFTVAAETVGMEPPAPPAAAFDDGVNEEGPQPSRTILGVAPPPTAIGIVPPADSPARTKRMKTARSATAGAVEVGPNDTWRQWALALSAARGAQPLAAFEKLFADSYVPLANAIGAGLDDPRALRAYDEFRRSFERSYTDAFATFGATNRRPRLVMDAFDLANKQARMATARSAHILVVDSMRFDLGAMVRDAVTREATGTATFIGETLLWSALPTTTMRQLETLARGMDALRAPAREEPSESLRGRAAEVVRRCRVGSREIHKLDLVPSLIDAAGVNVVSELPRIAEQVAEAVARHITTLAPRTLVFLVGDHGFSVDRRGHVHAGGASPEEVLVPAQTWLVGDLH
jgi:hypothetical protein